MTLNLLLLTGHSLVCVILVPGLKKYSNIYIPPGLCFESQQARQRQDLNRNANRDQFENVSNKCNAETEGHSLTSRVLCSNLPPC